MLPWHFQQISLHLLKKRIDEGADYFLYRQPVCDYSSSSEQGRNIACCKSYGKLKQHIRNNGLNIAIHFVVFGVHRLDVPLVPMNLQVGTQKQFEKSVWPRLLALVAPECPGDIHWIIADIHPVRDWIGKKIILFNIYTRQQGTVYMYKIQIVISKIQNNL